MDNKGQTLLEVVVVSTVGILVVTALTFAVIFSLRNASFAKNQSQATKLAQEGMERIRSIRDRDKDGEVYYIIDPSPPIREAKKFSDLWDVSFNCLSNCYFYFYSGTLTGGTASNSETVSGNFQRQFQIEEEVGASSNVQKRVTVIVKWTDFAGDHQSKLTTILRNIKL